MVCLHPQHPVAQGFSIDGCRRNCSGVYAVSGQRGLNFPLDPAHKPGFDPDHVLTFQVSTPNAILENSGQRNAYQDRLIGAVGGIRGVTSAAIVNQLPLDGCCLEAPDLSRRQARRPAANAENQFFR